MMVTRGNVTRTDEPRYHVLGLVSIALPGPWWWHTEDMKDPGSGAIFRCYEEGKEYDLGYLMVANISNDLDEPDISSYEAGDVAVFDRMLEIRTRDLMVRHGAEMINWM